MNDITASEDSFSTFVRDVLEKDAEEVRRMKKQVADYKIAIRSLYDTVYALLSVEVDTGAIQIGRAPARIVEAYHDEYEVEIMTVWIGSNIEVVLEPKGADIVGGFGRVDVKGPAGEFRLCLVDRTDVRGPKTWPTPRWVVVRGVGESATFTPLGKGSFQKELMAVSQT